MAHKNLNNFRIQEISHTCIFTFLYLPLFKICIVSIILSTFYVVLHVYKKTLHESQDV